MAENTFVQPPDSNVYNNLLEEVNEMRSLSKKHIDRVFQLRAQTATMELDIVMKYTPKFIIEMDSYKDNEMFDK